MARPAGVWRRHNVWDGIAPPKDPHQPSLAAPIVIVRPSIVWLCVSMQRASKSSLSFSRSPAAGTGTSQLRRYQAKGWVPDPEARSLRQTGVKIARRW